MALDPRFMKAFGQAMGDTIGANIADAITKGTGSLINLSGWAASLRNDASNAINSAATAQSTATTAQSTAAAAQSAAAAATAAAASASTKATTAQAGVITLASQANAPSNVPAWESPSPFLDVSFPWFSLQAVNAHHHNDTFFVTGGKTTNANLSGAVTGVAADANLYSLPAGTLAIVAVRLRADRIINEVAFVCGTPPTHVYVALFLVNDDGTATRAYDFGDQAGNISGNGIVELVTSADLSGSAGDSFYVGILPIGGALPIGAVLEQGSPPSLPSGFHPQRITAQIGSQSSMPGSIAAGPANLPAEIWVGVGQTTGSSYDPDARYTFDDDLERSAIGSSWVQTGQPVTITSGVALYGSTSDGRASYLYLNPLNTDNQICSVVLGGTVSGQAVAQFIRAKANFASGAVCYYNATGVYIGYLTAYDTFTGMTSDTTSAPPAAGQQVDFWNIGNVFYASWPGAAQVLTWTDTSGFVLAGSACRRSGFSLARNFFTNSAGVANWHANDRP